MQRLRDSVDTLVLAAPLHVCEAQNSIPIITLPICYLFSKLWGINAHDINPGAADLSSVWAGLHILALV